jgi:DNA-binding SARP family transcriptional activator
MLGSALTTLLVFAAIPAVLILIVGDPLSGGLGHQWSHLDRAGLSALTVVAWVSWVACCAQLLRAVVHHVRRGDVGVPLGAPLTERIAAQIAVGILAFTSVGTPLVMASGVGAGAAMAVRSHVGAPPHPEGMSGSAVDLDRPAVSHYVVRSGDSLWSIADAHMGDGADWTSIAALNLGRAMADGRHVVDPDLILRGWSLRLPSPSAMTDFHPASPAPAGPHGHRSSTLPELLVLGIGSIGCAALARRSRRARQLRQFISIFPGNDDHRSDLALDTDILLSRFAGVPALNSFEAANCQLGRALGVGNFSFIDHGVRSICVGPSGVTFWLSTPGQEPPSGFTLTADGRSWHITHDRLVQKDLFCPQFPIVLPVGDDEEGTWLVPLRPGTVVPLLGEAAAAMCRAARAVQESWSWADMVSVTDDPVDAGVLVQEQGKGRDGGKDRIPILFFGDPTSLAPGLAESISVVTTCPVAASDITVLVDRHGASIHPLGRTVRPHLLTSANARLIDELVRAPVVPSDTSVLNGGPDEASVPRPREGAEFHAVEFGREPGLVEVKLLTMSPRIVGLREELAPNRARRAVELVAYLALHRPDVVTSDRLRTRVLGSSDADAASKTLFNTATAARRAMGVDANGEALLPAGTRNGHYRVSDEVTVDVQRAAALVAFGNACEDPSLAMAHFRAALDLVEGEPLANALSGYSWWEVEGHGGRIAAILVNAACNMAALAIEAGYFELAQRGIDQARLVDPYSETLSRVAMEVAAAEGDADRLRREWRECQRRVDEVDPGSSPSSRTERLYGELSRKVPVVASGVNDF